MNDKNEDLDNIVVGPEGGFEPTELQFFKEQ